MELKYFSIGDDDIIHNPLKVLNYGNKNRIVDQSSIRATLSVFI